jgi:hypothetical protein
LNPSTASAGCCHTFSADGRCVTLHRLGQLFLGHLGPLLRGVVEVDVVQGVPAAGQQVDLDGLFPRINDPILGDSGGFVGVPFEPLVVPCRARGKDLPNQVRGALHPLGLDFIPVTDHHAVGNEVVVFGQADFCPVAKGDTGPSL